MYLFTLDWPLEKKKFQLKYIISIMHTTQVRVYALLIKQILKKTNQQSTHGSTAPDFLWIHLQTACKMLGMLCKMCSTLLEPWCQGISGIKGKKKKRKEKQIDSMLQDICSVIDYKWHQNVGDQGHGGQWED